MNRFDGNQAELVEELRKQFQERCGSLAAEPFTLRAEEVLQLLAKISPQNVLQGFTNVRTELLKLREGCTFVDESHIVIMLHDALSKICAQETRYRTHGSAKQQPRDFSVSYEQEKVNRRRMKYANKELA